MDLDKSGSYIRGISSGASLPSVKELLNIIAYFNTICSPNPFMMVKCCATIKKHSPAGVPLDNLEIYTKSDWLHWVACMGSKADFNFLTEGLWNAFHQTDRRVPMIDWYRAENGKFMMFQNRTVQGGLFMRYLF